jgi:hypothetical protein
VSSSGEYEADAALATEVGAAESGGDVCEVGRLLPEVPHRGTRWAAVLVEVAGGIDASAEMSG